MIRQRFRVVLQNPTGYYTSRLRVDMTMTDSVITDGGVVYGPWLEGTGSRNKTTRFKGYSTFRWVQQKLNRNGPSIAKTALPRYLRRMGG
jgi:hypothetical protein